MMRVRCFRAIHQFRFSLEESNPDKGFEMICRELEKIVDRGGGQRFKLRNGMRGGLRLDDGQCEIGGFVTGFRLGKWWLPFVAQVFCWVRSRIVVREGLSC